MKKLSLPIHPKEATSRVLKAIPSSRVREVLERRFGLRGRDPETLEAIGSSFKVTRERIRQIEADGLRMAGKPDAITAASPVMSALEKHLGEHGGALEETKLLQSVTEARFHPHVQFLLAVAPETFRRKPEDASWHPRWYINEASLKSAELVIAKTSEELKKIGHPVPAAELFQVLKNHAKSVLGSVPTPETLEAYLSLSREIKQNPYGEFGLTSWATIRPRGVRDRAYAVLAKATKPLHFREVAQHITKAGWSPKKAHPQTVHNELIKDPRFVLVGRGLYALSEWGYEAGTVSDMITGVLRQSKKPLSKDEIAKRVLEKRFVKPNTVFLNLQRKNLFRRQDNGYTLA